MFFVDVKGGEGRTTTGAVLSETKASLLLKCLKFFSELDMELSKFMRRELGGNDLRVFLDTDRGPVDTNSVRDFQHPLEWSFILHKSVNDCATSVSNLVLLFHRSSAGEDGALALAYCKTIKNASNV